MASSTPSIAATAPGFSRTASPESVAPSTGAEAEPKVTARRMIAFIVMVFGMFMAILDIQIVSASLSEIQAGISASADEIPWVQTSYLIAEVIMIPLSGFLSRAISTRYLFVASAAGFTAKAPIVDLTAFRDRNFWTGSMFSFILGVGLYGLTYLYPVYLARVRATRRCRSARPCS